MAHAHGGTSPRTLLSWFLIVTAAPMLALGWLGWQLIRQDHALERQRSVEQRERAADLAAASLQRTVAEREEQLSTVAALDTRAADWGRLRLPSGATVVRFEPAGLVDHAGGPLLFSPAVPEAPTISPDAFSTAS
jgi:hypothetical protein